MARLVVHQHVAVGEIPNRGDGREFFGARGARSGELPDGDLRGLCAGYHGQGEHERRLQAP